MLAVFKKELYRVFSDAKLVFTTFLLSPLMMIAIFVIILVIGQLMSSKMDKTLPKILVKDAPTILSNMEGFEVTDASDLSLEAMAEKVKNKDYAVAFVFDPNFMDLVRDSKNPTIRIILDSSSDYSTRALRGVQEKFLEPFKQKTIIERIGGEEKLNVYQIEDVSFEMEVADERKVMGSMVGKMAPYFILLMIFASAMSLVIESVAGEKERGTLATQLITPIKRESLALGKLFGLSVHAAVSAAVSVLSLFGMFLAVRTFLPANVLEEMSIHIPYGITEASMVMAILVPTLLMNTSLLMMLSSFGKTIKEATGYVMPLYMATIVLSMIPMNAPSGEAFSLWMYCVPILGQAIALSDVLSFSVRLVPLLIAIAVPLVIVVIMVWIIRNMFNNERMIVSE